MRYKFLLLVLLSLAYTQVDAFGQSVEKRRQITRTFKATPGVEVNVINKYGYVKVMEWAKDSVKFEIRLLGRAKTEEKLIKMLSLVNFRFINTGKSITAETAVGTTTTDLLSELQNFTNAIATIGSEAKIDIDVYIPKNCELNITNSFGDIYLDDVSQKLTIDLSHGDLKVKNITNNAKIKTRFGNADIKSVTTAKFITSFSEIELEKASALNIESKSTKYQIEEVGSLTIESRKDEFEIEKLKTIDGTSTFSKIEIEEFDEILNLKTKLGKIELNVVDGSFTSIVIKSEYTDIILNFKAPVTYNLMLKHTELDFVYPRDLAKLETITIDKEEETKLTKGSIGKGASSKSKIDIEALKGELKIFHN